MGIEPTIFALATRCSTTELHPHFFVSLERVTGFEPMLYGLEGRPTTTVFYPQITSSWRRESNASRSRTEGLLRLGATPANSMTAECAMHCLLTVS